MTLTTETTQSPLQHFTFPRTGKRGVPQQFPRRLYEMLDTETKSFEASPSRNRVISWSESGKAFRIFDVPEFANSILPRYFRTKKFSSFQRNLNLYGFAKVRRGCDTDMYAHPSFQRDQPDALFKLRKMTTPNRRRIVSDASTISSSSGSVAECAPPPIPLLSTMQPTHSADPATTVIHGFERSWIHQKDQEKQMSMAPQLKPLAPRRTKSEDDRGKLDLLALALEQEFIRGA